MNMSRLATIVWRLFLTFCLIWAVASHATTITGTFMFNGSPFNGSVVVTLNYPASTGTYINLPIPSGPIPILNGAFPSTLLDGNDTMLPKGSYYAFDLYDQVGNEITTLNYIITGSTFDLGTAVPTPIKTNNISLLDLLGLRSLSVNNLQINNAFQVGNAGTTYSASGLSGASLIDGIAFASGYNVANPSSTTCGIQEAINALPSTGGIVVLPQGACTVTTGIQVHVPITAIGFGSGGWSNSGLTSTTGITTLTNNTGGPLFSLVSSTTGGNLGPVIIQNLLIKGGNGDYIDVGSPTTFTNNVLVDGVWADSPTGCGLSVLGPSSYLTIRHSRFTGSTINGMCISLASSLVVTHTSIDDSIFKGNGNDGLYVNSVGNQDIIVRDSKFEFNNASGIEVVAGSTQTSIKASNSSFSFNLADGTNYADGYGYIFDNNQFWSGTSQLYGAFLNMPATTGVGLASATFKDNDFEINQTADIFIGTNVPYVMLYPQISHLTATYTASASSVTTGTVTVTVTTPGGAVAIGSVVTLTGFLPTGCPTINGRHTLTGASTSQIQFTGTCAASGGGGGFVGVGTMTVQWNGGSLNLHTVTTN